MPSANEHEDTNRELEYRVLQHGFGDRTLGREQQSSSRGNVVGDTRFTTDVLDQAAHACTQDPNPTSPRKVYNMDVELSKTCLMRKPTSSSLTVARTSQDQKVEAIPLKSADEATIDLNANPNASAGNRLVMAPISSAEIDNTTSARRSKVERMSDQHLTRPSAQQLSAAELQIERQPNDSAIKAHVSAEEEIHISMRPRTKDKFLSTAEQYANVFDQGFRLTDAKDHIPELDPNNGRVINKGQAQPRKHRLLLKLVLWPYLKFLCQVFKWFILIFGGVAILFVAFCFSLFAAAFGVNSLVQLGMRVLCNTQYLGLGFWLIPGFCAQGPILTSLRVRWQAGLNKLCDTPVVNDGLVVMGFNCPKDRLFGVFDWDAHQHKLCSTRYIGSALNGMGFSCIPNVTTIMERPESLDDMEDHIRNLDEPIEQLMSYGNVLFKVSRGIARIGQSISYSDLETVMETSILYFALSELIDHASDCVNDFLVNLMIKFQGIEIDLRELRRQQGSWLLWIQGRSYSPTRIYLNGMALELESLHDHGHQCEVILGQASRRLKDIKEGQTVNIRLVRAKLGWKSLCWLIPGCIEEQNQLLLLLGIDLDNTYEDIDAVLKKLLHQLGNMSALLRGITSRQESRVLKGRTELLVIEKLTRSLIQLSYKIQERLDLGYPAGDIAAPLEIEREPATTKVEPKPRTVFISRQT